VCGARGCAVWQGDYKLALEHLFRSGEPVYRILSLYPQLLPRGVNLNRRRPAEMPVLIDTQLPLAIPPLILYLVKMRRKVGAGGGGGVAAGGVAVGAFCCSRVCVCV
jgi:hypothetical protein